MDPTPDNLFISTALDDLRQQKTRLWVKTLILSILLGIFAIGTAVLAVLYATKGCALPPPSASTETLSTELPASTVTVTESGTRVRIITTTATESVTTTADISVQTTTSVYTTTLISSTDATNTGSKDSTETGASHSGPKKACFPGVTVLGQQLLENDPDYYFEQMKFAMLNQPMLVPGKKFDDEKIKRLGISSMWRCGDNGWIVFLQYCQGGVTDDNGCIRPAPSVT